MSSTPTKGLPSIPLSHLDNVGGQCERRADEAKHRRRVADLGRHLPQGLADKGERLAGVQLCNLLHLLRASRGGGGALSSRTGVQLGHLLHFRGGTAKSTLSSGTGVQLGHPLYLLCVCMGPDRQRRGLHSAPGRGFI